MSPAFVVVDKPVGVTSHDIVRILRSVTGEKAGHTGTLDPFATGVLPLALGRATRFIQFLDESEKVYDATIAFGSSTTTGDPEGSVVESAGPPELARLDEVIASFLGERMQTPPAYSAVKVDGRRLYEYARAGIEKRARPRPITIGGVEVLEASEEALRVRIRCSRGTYVRVLGAEIAESLGTVGHLVALRRLRSGPFSLEGALDLSTLSRLATDQEDWDRAFRRNRNAPDWLEWKPREEVAEALGAWTTPMAPAFRHLPARELSAEQQRKLGFGQLVPGPAGRWVALYEGEFQAVLDGGRILKSLAGG
ncbi:MAG TPA: tRNA pseudouridine(55) synthase TruB [Myxococcota bacterium]|nr:tRNA pseudouridine(55) synthase TruB [Myxococcota bacterium]